jgi:hypothetical protein
MLHAALQESDQPHTDFSIIAGHLSPFREEKKEEYLESPSGAPF